MNRKRLLTVMLVALTSGCSDTCDPFGTEKKTLLLPVVITSGAVSPAAPQVESGQNVSFSHDVTHNAIGSIKSTAWLSKNPAVATVNAGTGVATAVAPGTATIVATTLVASPTALATARTDSTTVTVVGGPPQITIAPGTVQLFVEESGTLECTVTQNGALVSTPKVWSTNAPSTVQVNPATGVVLGMAPGTAVITCFAPQFGISTTRAVTVIARHSITIAPAPVNLQVGANQALTVTVTSTGGAPITGRTIGFESLNTSIATVSGNGVVTGVAPGATQVRITVDGPGGGSALVTVNVTAGASACGANGTYVMTMTLTSDPGGHGPPLGMPPSVTLNVTRTNNNVSVTGSSPFISASGPINPATCDMDLTGSGTAAGFPNTQVRLTGRLQAGTAQSWLYVVGTSGNLPGGQPATYTLTR